MSVPFGHEVGSQERVLYDQHVDRLRGVEFPMLKGLTYLDHAGTTLPAKSLMETFNHRMQTTLLGNPHSSSDSCPNAAHQIIEDTRLKVLNLFGASPKHFDVVFVANATAGIKLVLEAFSGCEEGFDYYYHRDSHTSLVGVRELATHSRCLLSDDEVEKWIGQRDGEVLSGRPQLFAYPAQSNMNGRRLPLAWPALLRCADNRPRTYTLLDIAALASTARLDLRNHSTAPDFLVMSFYKIFGFPDLGALIVRKASAGVFDNRKYFGGGTTAMITACTTPWVVRKDSALRDRLEDGTGATHSILALQCAIETHNKLFGGLSEVSKHTAWLSKRLYQGLLSLRHENGLPLVHIYKDPTSTYGEARSQGGTIVFNVRNSDGTWVGSTNVGKVALEHKIHIRAGGLCNPAGMATALGLSDDDIQDAYAHGFRCNQPSDLYSERPYGMVRVSLGAMSTSKDLDIFLQFMEDYFVKGRAQTAVSTVPQHQAQETWSTSAKFEKHSTQSLEKGRSAPSSTTTFIVIQPKRAKSRSLRSMIRSCWSKSGRDEPVEASRPAPVKRQ